MLDSRKPQFTIRPDDELNKLIEELAELSNMTKNRVVKEALLMAKPYMEDKISRLKQAKEDNPDIFDELVRKVRDATDRELSEL